MRSDAKQTLILLVVLLIATACVVMAYMDRDAIVEQANVMMREKELYEAELEGVYAEQGAANPHANGETAKLHAWQTGYDRTHGDKQ